MTTDTSHPLKIFLVAGEESGDQLGGKLMQALKIKSNKQLSFLGVGGKKMEEEGLVSLFPLQDIAVMGVTAVIGRLPTLIERIRRTADAVIATQPDILVIIDSPDFTHRVAQKVRRRAPHIPIIDYVSPSVWAWRPGRAKKMRRYINEVMGILPFETEVHQRLGGPKCTYVGHPLIERLSELRPTIPGERTELSSETIKLLVLPGSRHSEVSRLMEPFGKAVEEIATKLTGKLEVVIPAVAHHAPEIERRAAEWAIQPKIILGESAKLAAFRSAHAALAASGTVTLELALSKVPMVVGYKVSKLEEQLRYVVKVPSMVLANLILQENVIPELFQWDCTPEKIVQVLFPLLNDGPERRAQLSAFDHLDSLMKIGADQPSERAARVILSYLDNLSTDT